MSAAWSKSRLSVVFVAAVWVAALPLGVLGQGPAVPGVGGKPRAFAVSSIRRNVSGIGTCDPEHFQATADGFRMTNCPLIAALFIAYVPAKGGPFGFSTEGRMVGAPEWMMSERYDIDARIDEADLAAWKNPTTQKEMLHAMMQSLLAERCKLVAHREMREKAVYALTVGKNGPKFKAAESVVPSEILAKHPNVGAIPGGGGMFGPGPRGSMELYGAPIETLAVMLSNRAGRPVMDKTGLTGMYDIKLEMQPPGPSVADGTQDPGLSVFTVVQEQLGLKLEPAQDAVETLVIDHVERPGEN